MTSHLSRVIESLNRKDIIWILADYQGRITNASARFGQLCGYSPQEYLGKKPKNLLQGPMTEYDRIAVVSSYLWNRLPISTTLTNYHKSGDDYRVHLSILPLTAEYGGDVRFLAVCFPLADDSSRINRTERDFLYRILRCVYGQADPDTL